MRRNDIIHYCSTRSTIVRQGQRWKGNDNFLNGLMKNLFSINGVNMRHILLQPGGDNVMWMFMMSMLSFVPAECFHKQIA
eukprot:snap_masked-scaffold_12-processed-gene-7.25-mRNA-1 protein AED:1.00 eAED:1.00 QI:0/-1/0/0/-1/1/1/0/79